MRVVYTPTVAYSMPLNEFSVAHIGRPIAIRRERRMPEMFPGSIRNGFEKVHVPRLVSFE